MYSRAVVQGLVDVRMENMEPAVIPDDIADELYLRLPYRLATDHVDLVGLEPTYERSLNDVIIRCGSGIMPGSMFFVL